MHPRTYNYLFGLLNSLGLYVFRDELSKGTLYGYPFKKTTQIPTNIWDATGTNKDCSFIILAEMNETMSRNEHQWFLCRQHRYFCRRSAYGRKLDV